MGGAAPRFLSLLSSSPFPLLRHRHTLLLLSSSSSSYFHRLSSSPSPSPSTLKLKPSQHQHRKRFQTAASSSSLNSDTAFSSSSSSSAVPHPWPEWSRFLSHISSAGYLHPPLPLPAEFQAFSPPADLPPQFVSDAAACFSFARHRPNLLRLLSKRDVAVVAEHGAPFLFRDAEDSVSKMKAFLSNNDATVLETDRATMVDLMKFMLSYASSPLLSSGSNNLYNRDLVESSVRNLFGELFKLSYNAPRPNSSESVQNQMSGGFGQTIRPRQKIEMKRGDWICPRCSFLNFSRNAECRKCEEARPKRQLTGGEWECPQCDFYNYGGNVTCLRCDCKRPGQISLGPMNTTSNIGYGNGDKTNTSDVDGRLAANEEKAQRWFSKVSQLDSSADINSLIADEDFPEIMPLRKGVNRFVVSTRKTPLERRLSNAQNRRNLGNNGPPGSEDFKAEETTRAHDTLYDNLGRSAGVSQSDYKNIAAEHNASRDCPASTASNMKGSNSSTIPPVPLSADMLAQKSENVIMEQSKNDVRYASSGSDDNSQFSNNSTSQNGITDKGKEQAEKSERWFRKVAELHNVSDSSSAISDEDFPEIMPMRKGENRFVVSKKKDRSLTSPAYKRRMAMEQSGNSNFVPFVPFPPDYFAKKDNQQTDGKDSTDRCNVESPSISVMAEKSPEMSDDSRARTESPGANYAQGMTNAETLSGVPANPPEMLDDARLGWERRENVKEIGNQYLSMKSWSPEPSEQSSTNNVVDSTHVTTASGNSSQSFNQDDSRNKHSSNVNEEQVPNLTESSSPASGSQNVRAQWTGKSLEGSAVKEPDPLDMSEEAKAERWFRRVAQIKDISELSQIPDEDFPSIMPMRKGVNRFVVSRRKTPLERRLTSQQYRRNLPVVSSDPVKKENEGS